MTNVLILCTGNSARSILGEALVTHLGQGRFRGFSAGSKPKGEPHPAALRLLAAKGIDTSPFTSKSWDVFDTPDAPQMDIIITVCSNAANEECPYWPGHPLQVHWGLPDPADVTDPGPEQDAAFAATWDALHARISRLVTLDPAMDIATLRAALLDIHATEPGGEEL